MEMQVPLRAPLWPAGHLPHKGGDYAGRLLLCLFFNIENWAKAKAAADLPLEGEMAGRPEGGAQGCFRQSVQRGNGSSSPCRLLRLPERRENRAHDAGGIQAGIGVHPLRLCLIHENVGHHQRADLEAAIEEAFVGQEV